MFRRSALVLGALLGAFHLWLFGQQAWTGQLADAATIARWGLALAVLGGLGMLARRGAPLLCGRQAVAMWVLAALLHSPAFVNDHDGFATPSMPEAVVTVAQAAASLSALGLALSLLLITGPWALLAAAGLVRPAGDTWVPQLTPGRTARFLPRPPPLA